MLFTSLCLHNIYAYNLAVVGASGRLGRELVYQATNDKNLSVIGYTTKPDKVYLPYRGNSFQEKELTEEYNHPKLELSNYWAKINEPFEHLIFCISAMPFENDYSEKVFKKFLEHLPDTCKSITILSANGVGNSIQTSNLGIKLMEQWYLKDVYRAKNVIETLLKNYEDNDIKKFIYRPNALSHGYTFTDSTSRNDLAQNILSNLFD